MSSIAVRNTFRAAFAAQFPTVPYIPTLAQRIDNISLPDLWVSDDFVPVGVTPMGIGQPTCNRETGTYRVYVVGKAGAGETAVITQADLISRYFARWTSVDGNIRTNTSIPPAPSQDSDGRWFIVVCDFPFRHDFVL